MPGATTVREEMTPLQAELSALQAESKELSSNAILAALKKTNTPILLEANASVIEQLNEFRKKSQQYLNEINNVSSLEDVLKGLTSRQYGSELDAASAFDAAIIESNPFPCPCCYKPIALTPRKTTSCPFCNDEITWELNFIKP